MTVTFTYEDGWWTAETTSPRCITQGRTLAKARAMVRDALACAFDDTDAARQVVLDKRIVLPSRIQHALYTARATH